jgi:hypothetical protein
VALPQLRSQHASKLRGRWPGLRGRRSPASRGDTSRAAADSPRPRTGHRAFGPAEVAQHEPIHPNRAAAARSETADTPSRAAGAQDGTAIEQAATLGLESTERGNRRGAQVALVDVATTERSTLATAARPAIATAARPAIATAAPSAADTDELSATGDTGIGSQQARRSDAGKLSCRG